MAKCVDLAHHVPQFSRAAVVTVISLIVSVSPSLEARCILLEGLPDEAKAAECIRLFIGADAQVIGGFIHNEPTGGEMIGKQLRSNRVPD
jgi:hypothetical protein